MDFKKRFEGRTALINRDGVAAALNRNYNPILFEKKQAESTKNITTEIVNENSQLDSKKPPPKSTALFPS